MRKHALKLQFFEVAFIRLESQYEDGDHQICKVLFYSMPKTIFKNHMASISTHEYLYMNMRAPLAFKFLQF